MVHSGHGKTVCWYTDMLVHRYVGTPICWYTDTLVNRYVGTPICWYINTLVHQYVGTPIRWLPTIKSLYSQHRRLQAWALPGGYFKSCALISWGPDTKTHGHQHVAHAYTDVRIAYNVVTKYVFPQLRIKCGVAKSCPGTHTALQAPMILNHHELPSH